MDKGAKQVIILGSTGSIGKQALDIIDKHPRAFKVVGLAARDEASELAAQIKKYRPQVVAVAEEAAYLQLRKELKGSGVRLLAGMEGLCELASFPGADTVLVAVSGAVGIKPTLAAIKAGKRIALANKETLVAAGEIVMQAVKRENVWLLPVDSEHSAIFQCVNGEEPHLKRIWLTASGGPFRDFNQEKLAAVSVDMALKHPTWVMGPKITIDSATLMNKGLEVIEAHHLFGIEYEKIKVIVHRESIIHSMIELVDGSFLAHLGSHDMRIPIQYALTFPQRKESPAASLDPYTLSALNFERPDLKRFPALRLAYQAGKTGGTMPAVMNAANEEAVNDFLNRKIKFTDIAGLVEEVMERHNTLKADDLDTVIQCDQWGRLIYRELSQA